MAACDYKYKIGISNITHRLIYIEHPKNNPRHTDYIDTLYIDGGHVRFDPSNKMKGIKQI